MSAGSARVGYGTRCAGSARVGYGTRCTGTPIREDLDLWLRALERAGAALGTRAAQARLLLFATDFAAEVRAEAADRADLESVDLERLCRGD